MIARNKTNSLKITSYIFVAILAVVSLIPFLLILSGSFTDEKEIVLNGIHLFPTKFSLAGYSYLFTNKVQQQRIVTGYEVSTFVTLVGTLFSVLATASIAYVLSVKSLRFRNHISFYIYFTMLFNGGMVPWYVLCVRYLHLKNTLLALILPMLINPFFVMIMRTFFKGVPDSLRESAVIDGAGELRILMQIIIPVAKPVIATISLFYMLNYWNDFYQALFFIDKKELVPLQYNLYKIISALNFLQNASGATGGNQAQNVLLPTEGVRLATTIMTIGPIVFVYPFMQRYFIKGITIGAVKG